MRFLFSTIFISTLFFGVSIYAQGPGFESIESEGENQAAQEVPATNIEGDIPAMVQEILDPSKEDAVKQIVERKFPHTASHRSAFLLELMRTLAAWRGQDAGRAFERLSNFVLEHFDSFEVRNELHFEKFSSPQEKFVLQVRKLNGPGTAKVRTRVIQHFQTKVESWAEGNQNEKYKALRYGVYLSDLLDLPEGVGAVQELAIQTNREEIAKLFHRVLEFDVMYGERRIGEVVSGLTYDLTKDFLALSREEDKSRIAHSKSRLLGRVLKDVFEALEKRQEQKSRRNPQPSVEHGASILKFATRGVNLLTGGLASSVTSVIDQGIDALAKYEKSQEEDETAKAMKELKGHFTSLVLSVFDQQVSNNPEIAREERIVLKEEFTQHLKEGFQLSSFELD